MSIDMITDLTALEAQEQLLQFETFSINDAWQLGCLLRELAQKRNAGVAIDIRVNGQVLFSHAMQGATLDNQAWIERKSNVVQRYQHSSWYVGQRFKQKGKCIEKDALLDPKQFAPFGGSFPIQIKSVGVIGSVTVSGLPQYEDHLLVVDALSEYLNRD